MMRNSNNPLFFLIISLTALVSEVTSSAETISFPVQSNSSPKFWSDMCFYKASEHMIEVEFYYSIAFQELQFNNKTGEYLASFTFSITVENSDNQIVFEEKRRRIIKARSMAETSDESKGAIDQVIFDLHPGDYILNAKVKDDNAKASSITGDFYIVDFGDSLTLSDPLLATHISKDLSQQLFIKGNRTVIPNPSRRYRYHNSVLYLYFEVYNFQVKTDSSEEHFKVGYTITDMVGDSLIIVPKQKVKKPGTSCVKMQALDIRGLGRGEHVLTVEVTDPASSQSISKQRRFWIYEPQEATQILAMGDDDIKRYRDQIKYITTANELDIFNDLPPKGKENFLLQFWHSKDTNPSTDENEFMKEHFHRIRYANKYFKGRKDGCNTDMGKVYIVYGPPDEVEYHEWETGLKAYQVWIYESGGHNKFIFVDRSNEGIYYLVHSTIINEINNANWMGDEVVY